MSIAKKRININMFTKKNWLIIGALAVLCAGVVGVNAYLSKKAASVVENPEEELLEESTSTEPEVISSTSEIDTSDWRTYRNEEYGFKFKYPKEIVGDIEESHFSKNDFGTLCGEKIKLNFMKEQNIILFARTPDYKTIVPGRSMFTKSGSDIKCEQPFTLISGENPYCDYTMCKLMEIAGEKAIFEVCSSNYECACDTFASVYLINPTNSKYKSLEFRIYLDDTEKKICSAFADCLEPAQKEDDIFTFRLWCKNLLLGQELSLEDEKRLNHFNNIISTFKFTK
jgi:hypothetical protein